MIFNERESSHKATKKSN